MPHRHGHSIWVVCGVPHREGYSWVVHGVPLEMVTLFGWFVVCPIEKFTLWVVCGVPHREGYSMGGPWCAP